MQYRIHGIKQAALPDGWSAQNTTTPKIPATNSMKRQVYSSCPRMIYIEQSLAHAIKSLISRLDTGPVS
jgi:hypothetical protein